MFTLPPFSTGFGIEFIKPTLISPLLALASSRGYEEERRGSKHGTPMRTHSFEVEAERERRGSRHTPTRMYSEPEPLVRRESDRMEKEKKREKRGNPKVDLDYNPWR